MTDTGIPAAGGAAARSGEGVPSGGEEAESPTDRTPFRPGEAADEPTAPGAESGPGGGVVALDDGSASALSVALVRFRRDLVGNFFSVLVLLAMLAVLVVVVTGALRGSPRLPGWPVWAVPALAAAGLVA
ncbi:MAG: hypothetical protein GWN71_24610, partial [Gammaproteobacteria bacterium]|nr:hypothetical protein [Gemmatimonadota bacterium]NIU76627.1 hypothetical protein [Gammaproteobacteria bacterium]